MRSSTIVSIVETSSPAIAVGGASAPACGGACSRPSSETADARALRLPHYCARCLGEPDDVYVYEQTDRRGMESTRSSVRVPMCSACLREVGSHARRAVELLAHCSVAGIVLAAFAWVLAASAGAAWFAALGPVIGVMLYSLHRNKGSVCSIDGALPYFENLRYQGLFERINGLDRSDYSPFAALALGGADADAAP